MFQFEKLLRDNEIIETDPDLPRAISKKIQKFRTIQKQLQESPEPEKTEELENQLDEIDSDIMNTLPEFFEIEDEEELERQRLEEEKKKKEEEDKKAQEEEDKIKAQQAAEENQKREAELKKPAKNDNEALYKLHALGYSEVTKADLEKFGFNTGFFGNLETYGCETKGYILRRKTSSGPYTLIKKGE